MEENVSGCFFSEHSVYILLDTVLPTDVINILWPPLDANQYGGPSLANWIYF